MIGHIFSIFVSVLILCVGIYAVVRPVALSERIKKFYSNYPIIRYAGEKQLTSRSGFVRLFGIILIILGALAFLSLVSKLGNFLLPLGS
jgi:uncharacterized membrane protein HdeD (DUF308 family)